MDVIKNKHVPSIIDFCLKRSKDRLTILSLFVFNLWCVVSWYLDTYHILYIIGQTFSVYYLLLKLKMIRLSAVLAKSKCDQVFCEIQAKRTIDSVEKIKLALDRLSIAQEKLSQKAEELKEHK
jgi:hypothetical protein